MKPNACQSLERVFHEPNRLAIMSALGGVAEGLTFNELKEQCRLTDGNLSRHLKALEEAGAVKIHKQKDDGARPQTTLFLTPSGRREFVEYLQTLESVLQQAAEALSVDRAPVLRVSPRQGEARI